MKEKMPELVEAYLALLKMSHDGTESSLGEIVERLCRVLEQYGIYVKEYIPEIIMMLAYAAMDGRDGIEGYGKIQQAFDLLRKMYSFACWKNGRKFLSRQRLSDRIILTIMKSIQKSR